MIPTIRDLSPASRDLLQRQIASLFPPSGIAGLYSGKAHSRCIRAIRLEIRCAVTKRNFGVAYFLDEMLLVRAMPVLVCQMNKCRADHRRNKRAGRKAA